jgi:hypothetical protein
MALSKLSTCLQLVELLRFIVGIAVKAMQWIRKCPKLRRFQDGLRITTSQKNHQSFPAAFLGWPQGTIMLWVLVSPEGQGLRDAPKHYRYLLAHQTNDPNQTRNRNLFTLRYCADRQWQVRLRNDQGGNEFALDIPDGLQPGWHHFLIAWDHSKPEVVFRIDDGHHGENRSNRYYSHWPEKQSDNIVVGAWVPPPDRPDPFPESYCNTMISKLWISDRFLSSEHFCVKLHRRLRPTS